VGKNTLTSGQRLTGDGPITLNDAMEFIQNIAGNKTDNLDWINGGSSYHEYMTDPRVWNADQRLIWNNMGGRLLNAPEKSNDGVSHGRSLSDPIQIGKNILKQVGINLDNPFASGTDQQLMNMYKEVVVSDTIESVIRLQDMKRESIQKTTIGAGGEIYKNTSTENYEHDRTAMATRPDWMREVFGHDAFMEDDVHQKVAILRDYGLDTNFSPSKFSAWNDDFNDGNVQYVYDRNSNDGISDKKSGKEISFDYHDYVGTVKIASPNIDDVIKKQKSEIERTQSYKKKREDFDGYRYKFTVTMVSPPLMTKSEKDRYTINTETYLRQYGQVSTDPSSILTVGNINNSSTVFVIKSNTNPNSGQISSDLNSGSIGSIYGGDKGCKYSIGDINSLDQIQEEESSANKDDVASNDAEIIKRGGAMPTSFEDVNLLLNDIDPQIFRFWIRTISRTHYEVTPEVFYLDDENKVNLARPRYTGHSAVFFDAVVKSMNENINPSWNAQSFFGRTEDVHTWQSTNRTLQFSTAFVATSPSQLPSLRAKVQELIRMCYPQIQAIRSVGVLAFRAGPIIELALGDMFRTFGYITSMSINWGVNGEPIWELSKYGQIVKGVELNLDIQILHKELPHAGTEFYAQSFDPKIFFHKSSDINNGVGFKTTGAYIQRTNTLYSKRTNAQTNSRQPHGIADGDGTAQREV
jgi:hypothetical protein